MMNITIVSNRFILNCYVKTIVVLRDVFHIGLVIGPRPVVLARDAAERQYSRPRTYN
jgi:hypothetical protein